MIAQNVKRMAYMKTKNVLDRDYYGTPPVFVEMAKKVMGAIELDPASCLEANERFVRASRFYIVSYGVERYINQPGGQESLRDISYRNT